MLTVYAYSDRVYGYRGFSQIDVTEDHALVHYETVVSLRGFHILRDNIVKEIHNKYSNQVRIDILSISKLS